MTIGSPKFQSASRFNCFVVCARVWDVSSDRILSARKIRVPSSPVTFPLSSF